MVQVAKFFGCHPEDVMSGSSFWIEAASATAEIEHYLEDLKR